jgi:hypothetical protein
VIAGFIIASIHPAYDSFLEQWGSATADAAIAFGIVGEVLFSRKDAKIQTELRRQSNAKLSDAVTNASEANERAAKADLARVKLEDQLRPRDVSQEQWDIIQSLRGKMDVISVAYETDFETVRFAMQIRDAFINAGIRAMEYRRAADVHSAGMFVYDPEMNGARLSPNVERIIDLFRSTGSAGARTALAVISALPTDVPASPKIPALIVGGRFLLPPGYVPSRKPPDV